MQFALNSDCTRSKYLQSLQGVCLWEVTVTAAGSQQSAGIVDSSN